MLVSSGHVLVVGVFNCSVFTSDRVSSLVDGLTSNDGLSARDVLGLATGDVLTSSGVLGLTTLDVNCLPTLDVVASLVLTSLEFGFQRLFGIVDDLSLNWNVFVFLDLSFSGDVFDGLLGNVLRNVLSQVLNGVIVGLGDFSWDGFDSLFLSVFSDFSGLGDSLDSDLVLVFNDFLLEWNVFDSALTLDDLFASVNNGVNDLWALDVSGLAGTSGITGSSGIS